MMLQNFSQVLIMSDNGHWSDQAQCHQPLRQVVPMPIISHNGHWSDLAAHRHQRSAGLGLPQKKQTLSPT
jgi:hypothetical protein